MILEKKLKGETGEFKVCQDLTVGSGTNTGCNLSEATSVS